MIHGLVETQDYEVASSRNHWFGVNGGAIFFSRPSFQNIAIPVTFHNFATELSLRSHVDGIRSGHSLNGTLLVTNAAGHVTTWTQTALIGFDESGAPFFDGLGKHLWVQQGTLKFVRISS